jgi:drug/metabolite transporter, DME family
VLRYRLYVLAAALLFSTGGAAIKATSLPWWQVGSLRSMIAGLVILAVLPESRRKWTGAVWIAGVFYALTLALFAIATKLTTAASAIFLQATAPLYMLVIGPLFLHEKLRRRDVGLSAAAGVGLLLFFFDPAGASATAPEPLQGNIYAATTGFTWALTVTAMRWMARNPGGPSNLALVALGNLLAFAIALVPAWPLEAVSLRDGAILLYLGTIQIGLSYYLISQGVKHVSALETSALILLEPAMNPVWTYLAHGETPGTLSIWGAVVIFAATLGHTWLASRAAREERRPTRPLPRD